MPGSLVSAQYRVCLWPVAGLMRGFMCFGERVHSQPLPADLGARAHTLSLTSACRILALEKEAVQLRTDKEVLEKQLARAEDTHKAELAKLSGVSGSK